MWKVRDGIYGLCVADALGVPVEMRPREKLRRDPVTGMRGYGTHHQPPGTWSDDSSMTLCLARSLGVRDGLDTDDLMERFLSWFEDGAYTPWIRCFDWGETTARALCRYRDGTPAERCGGIRAGDNGNGSLMRVLPLAYVLYGAWGPDITRSHRAMEEIHRVSGLTHRHPLAQSACGIYVAVAARLLGGQPLPRAIVDGVGSALAWYRGQARFAEAGEHWSRLADVPDFARLPEEAIRSGGYVVETLEAALWCLLNTEDYRDCVLRAVNLGGDADSTAAVAGGLAGLAYGMEGIPAEWVEALARRELIEACCADLEGYCERHAPPSRR